jgi:Peptidase family M23
LSTALKSAAGNEPHNGTFSDMTITLLTLATLTLPPSSAAAAGAPVSAARAPVSVPSDPVSSVGGSVVRGSVAGWPLQPRPEVLRGFELPAKPWLRGHRGVDLAGRPGQPVLAATPGTVTYAGPLAGRGVIAITFGARRTTYEPVVPEVQVGATVRTGTVIGRLSAAGSHCLPRTCLHWGLLQGKQYLNPLTLLPNRPVRLLPLTNVPPRTASAPQLLPPSGSRSSPAPGNLRSTSPVSSYDALGDSAYRNRRAAKLVMAAAAALTLTAGLLLRRQ